MGGSERGGDQPPQSAACLQPDDSGLGLRPAERHALEQLHEDGFVEIERVEAEHVARRMALLTADNDVVKELRATGFAGQHYDVFKATLAAYGYAVIEAWIRRRLIYQLTAGRGRPVRCPDEIREHLARDTDDRQELAMEIIAEALKLFREHALVQGKWSPTGGASLTTYFVGAGIATFPNVFRAWLREHQLGRQDHYVRLDPTEGCSATDPADVVCEIETFEEALKAASSDRIRHAIAAVVVQDVTYAEVAQRLGTTEAAVKMLFQRLRKRARGEDGGWSR
jgi:DNA-directed RNA polymerase specialized sigma24 family protein